VLDFCYEGVWILVVRILVVDDLESHLYLAKSLLEPFGYEVQVATGPGEALNALQSAGPFDLILSDIGMRDASGFDFIKTVKVDSRWKSIPFIFITATYWAEADKRKGIELGAAKFLFRPVDARAILTEIEEVLPPHQRLSQHRQASQPAQ
jgi:two-component system, cell cycle response regulator